MQNMIDFLPFRKVLNNAFYVKIRLLGSLCQFQAYFPYKYYAFQSLNMYKREYFEASTHLRHSRTTSYVTRKIQFEIFIFTHHFTDSL